MNLGQSLYSTIHRLVFYTTKVLCKSIMFIPGVFLSGRNQELINFISWQIYSLMSWECPHVQFHSYSVNVLTADFIYICVWLVDDLWT